MPVVDVRNVRVVVLEHVVYVRVGMRLPGRVMRRVRVLVMRVMHMAVLVGEAIVHMDMLVSLPK